MICAVASASTRAPPKRSGDSLRKRYTTLPPSTASELFMLAGRDDFDFVGLNAAMASADADAQPPNAFEVAWQISGETDMDQRLRTRCPMFQAMDDRKS